MKKLAVMLVLAATLLLSGCEASEVQRRTVVHAIGIDAAEDGFEVSYQVFSGSGSDSGPVDASESTVVTVLAQGATLYEAEQNLGLQTGKEVFLGDVELIIISEDLEDYNLAEFLQYFRKADIYLGVNVVYCRGKAKDIIGAKLKQGSATALLLRGVVESAIEVGRACSPRIIQISNAIEEDGEGRAIPILSLEKSGEASDDTSVSDVTLGIFNSLIVSNTGVGGEVDESTVMGNRILRGNAKQMVFEVEVGDGTASVKVEKMKIKRKVSLVNDLPLLDISIEGAYEVEYAPTDVKEDEIRVAAEQEMLKFCAKSFESAQKYSADLFELSKLLAKYEPEYAASLGDGLSNIVTEASLSVSAKLKRY